MWTRSKPVSTMTVVTPPASEPITLEEAKKHVFIADSDNSFDQELIFAIQAAREQWESDTDTATISRTVSVTLDYFSGQVIELLMRPMRSVTSVVYYDQNDAIQTLSTSIYHVDLPGRAIRLVENESWPTTAIRWDAVTITYVIGEASRAAVPAVAKQAMLLLIGYYTMQNKGDNDRPYDLRAYESLVNKFRRSSYP
jgi:uncharacterized phiE125 gp8 family phage protein